MSGAKTENIPKPTSATFKQLVKKLRDDMDLPTLVVIVEGTLDRMSMDLIIKKMMRGRGGKTKNIAKNILIAQTAKAFYASYDSAHMALKLLDKRCVQERHIVASLADGNIEASIGSMEALIFPNERARMVWALFRDGRPPCVNMGQLLVQDTLEKLQFSTEPKASLKTPEQAESLMAQMKNTEIQLLKKKEDLEDSAQTVSSLESERATLLVKLGHKENQYKTLLDRFSALQKDIKAHQQQAAQMGVSKQDDVNDELVALREECQQLRRKLARQERKTQFSKNEKEEAGQEQESFQQMYEAEKRKRVQSDKENERLQMQLAQEMVSAKEKSAELRASLKRARKIAVQVKNARTNGGQSEEVGRMGVFVDAANLSASAMRSHGGMFDFNTFLKSVSEGQKVIKATAYIVKQRNADENQSKSFDRFVTSLRYGGFEIQQKTPRQRKDGSQKADWDLGIAMDIVSVQQRLDIVLLASGDGDFLPLLNYLKKRQKSVIVAAFRHSASEPLLAAADKVILLDDDFDLKV